MEPFYSDARSTVVVMSVVPLVSKLVWCTSVMGFFARSAGRQGLQSKLPFFAETLDTLTKSRVHIAATCTPILGR